MANIGFKIYPDFKRADKALIEGFRGISVANIGDNMGREAAMASYIKPVGAKGVQLLGSAFTVKVPAADNLMFHKALDMVQPGDVLMIDAGGYENCAITGGQVFIYLQLIGLAGVVIDGATRDSADIAALENFPVYAKSISPNGPHKNGPGEIRGVISIGGVAVRPGDIVVGDEDGIVVVKQEEAEAICKKARATKEKEEARIAKIRQTRSFDHPWVDETLRQLGCEGLENL